LGGERVHVATDRLDRFCDLDCAARVRALEQEVLEEVARAGELVGLVARSRADPEPDRDRSQAGHRLGDDPRACVETRATNRRWCGSSSHHLVIDAGWRP
jgi:hypothetical protein